MKAIIKKNSEPKLLAVNLNEGDAEALRALAKEYKAEFTAAEDMQFSVARLLGEKTSDCADSGKYPDSDSPCIVFAGFERAALNGLLDDMKSMKISIPLKAICTPHNRDWSLAHLIAELTKEHKMMKGGGRS